VRRRPLGKRFVRRRPLGIQLLLITHRRHHRVEYRQVFQVQVPFLQALCEFFCLVDAFAFHTLAFVLLVQRFGLVSLFGPFDCLRRIFHLL